MANDKAGTILRFDKSGKLLSRTDTSADPCALAAAGKNMWLACHESASATLYRLQHPALVIPTTGYPNAVAFDGERGLWVAYQGGAGSEVARLDFDSGKARGPAIPVGNNPRALAYGGRHM